jgi:hypothetical protein
MSQPALQLQPRKTDDSLVVSLESLRQALAADVPGREREWAEAVGAALVRIEGALRQQQAAAQAPDGSLAEVDETRPTLARQADALRNHYDDLLVQLLGLREEVRRAVVAFTPAAESSVRTSGAGVADFGTIRQQAEQILTGLQENKETEAKLVLESVTTDIGAGD